MLRVASVLLAAGLATACMMRRAAVWLEPSSTPIEVRFGFAQTRGGSEPLDDLREIRVSACGVARGERYVGERVLWRATGDASLVGDLAGRFKYGEPPVGLTTQHGPEPLVAGCYVISISGVGVSASDCFEVRAGGSVERSNAPGTECQVRERAP